MKQPANRTKSRWKLSQKYRRGKEFLFSHIYILENSSYFLRIFSLSYKNSASFSAKRSLWAFERFCMICFFLSLTLHLLLADFLPPYSRHLLLQALLASFLLAFLANNMLFLVVYETNNQEIFVSQQREIHPKQRKQE